jgi:hypothetical protein
MNKRFKNRIDFLEAPNTPNYKYTDVLVKKVPINRSNYAENEG